ncbi:hypothetical protein MFLAVUS_009892 [Mucor flavus]|uniref:Uncharacterized protein n=1 Tax=Mucor flavus TaxID=439312 RepID=A0ABP9ZB69_9FUNG
MKLSITAASIFALACFSSVKADSYSDAIAKFCDGLAVTNPTVDDVFVAGNNATVTVTREPNERTKTITGLDLYSVDGEGNPKYVQNTWAGSYELQTSASISDDIPADTPAGLYYYRVWVTNMIDGQHGPDCIKTSRTFKVTTSSHTNDAGFTSYAQALDDPNFFKPEFAKGCFGLTVKSPSAGDDLKLDSFVPVELKRDGASQTDSLTKVEIYKAVDGADQLVDTVWSGQESLGNAFIYKDHLKISSDKYDPNSSYYYKIDVTSQVKGETCSFQSGAFKVSSS